MKQPERSTYLLIYAPRREVLEVWPARSGKCLRTFKCGSNCALMCPILGASGQDYCSEGLVSAQKAEKWQDCFVLNGSTGHLFSMTARLAGPR
jgi:hypothetical protein